MQGYGVVCGVFQWMNTLIDSVTYNPGYMIGLRVYYTVYGVCSMAYTIHDTQTGYTQTHPHPHTPDTPPFMSWTWGGALALDFTPKNFSI